MPLNDVAMLPMRIRTMQPMDDLLASEDIELELLHQTILHKEAQLFICTAEEELPRYERCFALPTNPSLPTEERRKRIIAKMNARAPCTFEFMRTTIENLTGLKVSIEELYSAYALCFTVHLNDLYELDLPMIKSQIAQLRPAHLTFQVLLVAQTVVTIGSYRAFAVGTHKQYIIPVAWSVQQAQSADMATAIAIPVQSRKGYAIPVEWRYIPRQGAPISSSKSFAAQSHKHYEIEVN